MPKPRREKKMMGEEIHLATTPKTWKTSFTDEQENNDNFKSWGKCKRITEKPKT